MTRPERCDGTPVLKEEPVSDAPAPTAATLAVDLKEVLATSDLRWEAALQLARESPARGALVLIGMLCGRAGPADHGREIRLEPAALPYRAEVLAELARLKADGQRLRLEDSSAVGFVSCESVASHLALFEEVSQADRTSEAGPAEWTRPADEGVRRFVHAGHGPRGPARPHARIAPGRTAPRVDLAGLVRALRPHQWAKNVLLFVPLVMAHRLFDVVGLGLLALAFVAFSLAASFVYVVNDLLDLPSDRRHPRKCRRPFASGRVPIPHGLGLAAGLLAASAALSAALSGDLLLLVGAYVVTSLCYTVRLKRTLMIDVIVLSGLYTLRLFAGGVVAGVTLSPWLLAFSMFFFLSLAFAKRYVELSGCGLASADRLPGRGYAPVDLDIIRSVGPTSGYLAVLVVCLYIHDGTTAAAYRHPERLWWICPALLYWITRVWFLAQRGELHDDPVLFALKDRRSLLTGVLTLMVFLAAWF